MSGTPSSPAKKRAPLAQRTLSFTLTIPRVLSLMLGLLLAFLWFFIMGLFIGRGYEPEKDIPELAQYMPKPQANATQVPVTVRSEGSAYSPADNYTTGARTVVEEADRAYRDSLRRNQTAAAAPAAGAAPPRQVQGASQAQTRPQVQPPATADTIRYHYVYQVASFKDAAQAQTMADKLVKGGLKARVTQSSGSGATQWHRVVVDHTGTPDSTDTLRNSLKQHKLDKMLLVSKKPA